MDDVGDGSFIAVLVIISCLRLCVDNGEIESDD